MRLSELRGKPVISIAEARRVGVVDDVLVDPSFRWLTALRIRSERHGSGLLVAIENVRGIGPDAVTISAKDVLFVSERTSQLAGDPPLRDLMNSRLVSDRGDAIGRVREVDVDPATRAIRSFIYVAGTIDAILDRAQAVGIGDVLGVGPGVVTIRTGARPVPVGGRSGRAPIGRGRLGAPGIGRAPEPEGSGGDADARERQR